MLKKARMTVLALTLLAGGLASLPAQAETWYTYREDDYAPGVTVTSDRDWQMCIDHHGVYGPDGCYIQDRNERLRMREEEGSDVRFRAHEEGVYDRD